MALALPGGLNMALLNIKGERSGLLVAIEFSHINKNHKAVWECRCDCGNICYKLATDIHSKKAKSCGCATEVKKCKICGAVLQRNKKAYCSDECLQKGHIDRARKSYNKIKKKREKNKEVSLLDKTLKALREYNAENGTNLSYGFFVHMLEVERLKNAK